MTIDQRHGLLPTGAAKAQCRHAVDITPTGWQVRSWQGWDTGAGNRGDRGQRADRRRTSVRTALSAWNYIMDIATAASIDSPVYTNDYDC